MLAPLKFFNSFVELYVERFSLGFLPFFCSVFFSINLLYQRMNLVKRASAYKQKICIYNPVVHVFDYRIRVAFMRRKADEKKEE